MGWEGSSWQLWEIRRRLQWGQESIPQNTITGLYLLNVALADGQEVPFQPVSVLLKTMLGQTPVLATHGGWLILDDENLNQVFTDE
ncbi:unnamed protein product [Lepidochelys kempii]